MPISMPTFSAFYILVLLFILLKFVLIFYVCACVFIVLCFLRFLGGTLLSVGLSLDFTVGHIFRLHFLNQKLFVFSQKFYLKSKLIKGSVSM